MITLLASGLSSSDDYIVPSSVRIKHLNLLVYKGLFVVAVQAYKVQLVDKADIVLDILALVEWVCTLLAQLLVLDILHLDLLLMQLGIRPPYPFLKQVKIYWY
jgi:hypothetical protein